MFVRTALVIERRQPADSSSAKLLAGTHARRMATGRAGRPMKPSLRA
jgi:hypothetical protein